MSQRAASGITKWLGAVVVLALVVRLLAIVASPHYVPATDSADYDVTAVSLVRTGSFPASSETLSGGPTAFRPPLFPVALAGVYELSGVDSASGRWLAGRVLQAILGAIAVGLLWLIVRRLWGPHLATLAGGLAAVFPPLVLIGTSLMVEPLFIVFELGAVLAALSYRAPPHRRRSAVAAGALCALAALTRGNGIVLVIPVCLLVWRGRPRRSWPSLRAPLAVLAVAGLVLLPWAIRDTAVFHRFVPLSTETGYALAGTYNDFSQHNSRYPALWIPPGVQVGAFAQRHPGASEAEIDAGLQHDALRYIAHDPVSILRTGYWTTLRLFDLPGPGLERLASRGEAYPLWLAELSVYAFWVVGALALLGACQPAARRAPGSLWLCPLAMLLSTVLIIGTTRYRAPADPFFIILAAFGISATPRVVARFSRRRVRQVQLGS